MRSILSIIMLFTLFGDIYPQIAVIYNQKRNTLFFKDDYLYDDVYKYKIGEENGVQIEHYILFTSSLE